MFIDFIVYNQSRNSNIGGKRAPLTPERVAREQSPCRASKGKGTGIGSREKGNVSSSVHESQSGGFTFLPFNNFRGVEFAFS